MSSKARVVVIVALVVALVLGVSVLGVALEDRFFGITMIIPIGNEAREKAGQIIARDLEKIGIGVNLRYMEFAAITPRYKRTAQTGATFDEGGYDMYMTQTNLDADIDPSGFYKRYACDQYYPDGSNQVRYCNPEFDNLVYEALQTVDSAERWALVQQAEAILYEDLPTIPVWRPAQFYTIQNTVVFPEDEDPFNWQTYSLRWARREIDGKTKEDMSLRERTLIWAQPSDVDAFLPGFSTSGYTDRAVEWMAYDALIQRPKGSYTRGPAEELGPRPALAKAWEASEDGKTWTVYLRDDVLWHDGEPFTADDVIFTYDLVSNPDSGYGSSGFYTQNGITWEAVDNYTVKFHCNSFNPLFPSEVLAQHMLPEHLLRDILVEDLPTSEYNVAKIVGTGPWVLDEYRPGEYIKYKANDTYYGGRPWFDYVVIRIMPEAATAWYSVKVGEVDITETNYGFTGLGEVEDDPNLYAILEPTFGPQLFRINNSHPILGNPYVRQAISLACNRQVIVDVINGGLGEVANQHLPQGSPGYNPDLPPLLYDLNQAKHMLEMAGYDYDTIKVEGPSD